MRLVSWNVNGIRAAMKKDFAQALHDMNTDVICLQETKAQDDQVMTALEGIEGFHVYANSADKKGYSGTAILTRTEPLSIHYDMDQAEHNLEGRVIALEFDTYFLVTVYTPNSGSELKRLDYREQWDADFLTHLKQLEQQKPVVVCGDLNVAHRDIDLARAKPNYNKSAGYMQREIDGLDNLVAAGFIDTFRYQHPDEAKYSWWSYRAGARGNNVGWRIDYFMVSDSIKDRIEDADILTEVMGSDHCPVQLDIKL
ncbi:MAG: exodeoxyribonuclease III [Porticoccaceae bacterium]|nr:exodeoxyribonuclease III [Porticoccaceae bacterium]